MPRDDTDRNIFLSFDADETLFCGREKFVCQLYGGGPNQTDVNKCRYDMFCTKQSQSQSLPPCQDALKKHIQRANYQAAVWRRTLEANPEIPSPEGRGWFVKAGHIEIDWMSLPPAPEALLELILCGCTGNCSTGHCIHARGMVCLLQMHVSVAINVKIPTMCGKTTAQTLKGMKTKCHHPFYFVGLYLIPYNVV
jgi:hypothetical protein